MSKTLVEEKGDSSAMIVHSRVFPMAGQKISNVALTFNYFTALIIVKMNAARKPDHTNFNINDTLECRAVSYLNKKKIYTRQLPH